MHGELVSTLTGDRARLNGFLVSAQPQPAGFADAALVIHGLAGNFYGSTLLLEIASRLERMGISALLANTRGHDFLNWTLIGGRTGTAGAAVEDVDDCRADIAGWVRFLVAQGYRRILLVGHSLGAIKSLYSQAHQPAAEVVGIVAVSPTRLNSHQFLASPSAEKFRETLQRCESLIEAGQGDQLLQVDFPFPTWISARAYVAKYGHDNRFDWFRFIDQVTVPTAMFFGQRELADNPAFAQLEEALPALQARLPGVTFFTVSGADHFYIARSDALGQQIETWLGQQQGLKL